MAATAPNRAMPEDRATAVAPLLALVSEDASAASVPVDEADESVLEPVLELVPVAEAAEPVADEPEPDLPVLVGVPLSVL